MFIYFCLSLWSGVFGDVAVKSVSVMEGESVTLNIDVNTVETDETDDQIQWRFRHNFIIALMYRQSGEKTVYDDVLDGRFRGRLELDQTGSLTITDTRTTDSGLYTVKITNNILYKFNLTVYARLSVPVISRNSSQCSSSSSSSSSSYCSLVCSVVNVGHVTLSWYKGNSLLSSISVSDLSISLSLPLEVECLDKNSYSCVLNNPISTQTTHLDITQLCHTCYDSVSLIVLVSAAVAGYLLIVTAVMIFCICWKHRKTDQEVETCEVVIIYVETTFYKENAQKTVRQFIVNMLSICIIGNILQ
uniref:Ig-like domain-containing protein n=1 Tax=Cyprinus carpio TaxID=7962 RepID=A0A8C1P256_CYPCA